MQLFLLAQKIRNILIYKGGWHSFFVGLILAGLRRMAEFTLRIQHLFENRVFSETGLIDSEASVWIYRSNTNNIVTTLAQGLVNQKGDTRQK